MSHKVDIAEVNEFSQSLKSASNDIALGIDSVINDIHQIRSMNHLAVQQPLPLKITLENCTFPYQTHLKHSFFCYMNI